MTHRSGTIYVYAKNALGKYSAPAILTYNKPAPPAGKNVVIQPNIATIGIVADPLPEGCIAMTVYINSEVAYSTNNALTYPAKPGIYTIAIAYRDYFGEGEKTPSYMTTVRKTIDPALIGEESITLSKIDKAVQGEIAKATTAQQEITRVVGNLSSVESARAAGYTAITQLQDAIGLKVSKGDIKSEVALGLQGVTLSGKQVHITGDTVIDKDVITKGMIQAGAITGDKLDVKDLSSITANIGNVQGGTITGATIRNYDGSFSVSPNGDIKGARIDAASVFASGRVLRPVIVSEQRLHSGDTIAYPQGADPAKCLVIVKYFEPLVFVSDNTFTHKPYTEGAIINKYNGYCVQSTHVLVNQWRGEDYDAAKNATGYDWPASVDPEQAQNPKSTYYDTSMHDDGVLHFHEAPMMQWVKQPRMRSNVVYGAGSDCCMDLSAALAMITSGFKVGEFYNNNMRYDRNDYTGYYSNGAVFDQSVAKGKVYNYFGWRLNWGEYWGMRITSGYVDIVVLSFW